MAYKLDLPSDCQLHPVFHISSLRQKLGKNVVPLPTLPLLLILLISFIQNQLQFCSNDPSSLEGGALLKYWCNGKANLWKMPLGSPFTSCSIPSPCGQGVLRVVGGRGGCSNLEDNVFFKRGGIDRSCD